MPKMNDTRYEPEAGLPDPPAHAGGPPQAIPVEQEGPAEEGVKSPPTPEEAEAIWRAGLRPEMRPIALRHGRALFQFAANIGMLNGALQKIAQVGQQTNVTLSKLHARQAAAGFLTAQQAAHQLMAQAGGGFVELIVQISGWSRAQIVECQTDIDRAAQLVLMAQTPGKIPSGIILTH